jgi:hypothetical protein
VIALAAAQALALALALAGGGGGGGGDGGGGGAPPADGGGGGSATGFIPAPPALGAVLQADAAQLLPMRGGQTWHYAARAGADRYGVLVRSTGGGDSMTLQRDSSAPDDDDAVTLSQVGSEIRLTTSLAELLGAGSGPLSYVLLRSPVRQDDQTTLLDRNGLALNVDLDGDGVGDSADVAAYSRVVGSEAVTLPDLQRSLDAVRVDTTLVLRLRRSAAGALPVERVVQSDW